MARFIDRTGETRIMNNGLLATIISYRNKRDIDVQFENGGIVLNNQYGNFSRGGIKCPMIFEYIDDYVKVTNPNVTPAFSFLIDRVDVPLLGEGRWSQNGNGYACKFENGKYAELQRLIMMEPVGMKVDHISGDKSDYRRNNLRVCTNAENTKNQKIRSDNTSGYKGVSWKRDNNKWQVAINSNGKRIHLGYRSDPKEAARVYNEAALKYHGEFARLNDV